MKTILLVDDDPGIMKTVSFRLEKSGYRVISAADGAEALVVAREHHPDLVLLDLSLPVCDGYEVCRRLKISPETRQIPVIFFTASTAPSRIADEQARCGAVDCVIKPFEPNDLLSKIHKHIG
ncbi:MAG: response regulator [Candidatus Aureabacteria bacterium]|nr:response regulator [Candidatus Auribacterota bacterium]